MYEGMNRTEELTHNLTTTRQWELVAALPASCPALKLLVFEGLTTALPNAVKILLEPL